ncbi:hypothetical protein ACLB1Q_34345 [Escherichia coli]
MTYVLLPPVAGTIDDKHAGSFRDDDFYINHCQETGWSVMLVADGAGSAVISGKAPGLQSKRLAITFSISSVV